MATYRNLNLTWHNGQDIYSDGPIEREIHERLASGEQPEALLRNDDRWPVWYHFSPMRSNIISWLPYLGGSSVLEIGAGLGAVTGGLVRRAGEVTCVELSLLRSQINDLRHPDADNLEIIVGNLNDIPFQRQFDVVTLIGVLEYSGRYTADADPYGAFLRKAASLVRPGGHLVVAIENRLGLKYFAGAREDHYGEAYVGLDNYPEDRGIRTFSLLELQDLLKRADLPDYTLYLPMPDYKFPMAIVAADAGAYFAESLTESPNFGEYAFASFDQNRVFSDLIRQKTFVPFANAFLLDIICGSGREGRIS